MESRNEHEEITAEIAENGKWNTSRPSGQSSKRWCEDWTSTGQAYTE
jgi:hypothetical protein